MTVCVGAIYENNSVLGGSDRMITAGGNIEFQPLQPKIWPITSSIVAMVADDIVVHTEIHQEVFKSVSVRIEKEPQNWWKVKDVADLYSQFYIQLRLRSSSRSILSLFGLDTDSFIKKQKEMSPEFVKNIEEKLTNYHFSGASAIIAGIDQEGPHIYTVTNEEVICNDKIGFSVIGSGYWHAASHFMFSGHTRFSLGQKVLLTTHQAKRKAEVAPGVGRETDMFLIGPQLGSFRWIEKEWIDQLDKIFEENVKKTEKLNQKLEVKLEAFLKKQAEIKQAQQKATVDPNPPNDSKV